MCSLHIQYMSTLHGVCVCVGENEKKILKRRKITHVVAIHDTARPKWPKVSGRETRRSFIELCPPGAWVGLSWSCNCVYLMPPA